MGLLKYLMCNFAIKFRLSLTDKYYINKTNSIRLNQRIQSDRILHKRALLCTLLLGYLTSTEHDVSSREKDVQKFSSSAENGLMMKVIRASSALFDT